MQNSMCKLYDRHKHTKAKSFCKKGQTQAIYSQLPEFKFSYPLDDITPLLFLDLQKVPR